MCVYLPALGFGYAPAPQKRLRRRLAQVHNVKVTLINEYNTSQMCSCCGNRLVDVRTTIKKDGRPTCRPVVWGVKRCERCVVRDRHGRHVPLFVDRDRNAARNILDIFMCLAMRGIRPAPFVRAP